MFYLGVVVWVFFFMGGEFVCGVFFVCFSNAVGGDCQCTGIRREFIPDKYVWPQQRAMDVFPIVCLIHRLAWKSVVILFDSTQGDGVSVL